jgi:glycine/D-amino acid oxidase-like deaminating enzyme/nitrite reductase/ring-hydroxylating ferredoxin subunit
MPKITKSLWMDSAPVPERPPLAHDLDVDVCVVGAGVLGMTTALLLARDGIEVAVVDAWSVGAGVTGHTTAKVSVLHGSAFQEIRKKFGDEGARMYARANQAGLEKVASLVSELGIDCDFRRKPSYTYVADPQEASTIDQEVEATQAAGLHTVQTAETPLPYPVATAVRLDDQAEFHSRRYVLGLAEELERLGATIYDATKVTELSERGGPSLTTEAGRTIRARNVVVATLMPIFDRGLFFSRCMAKRSYCVAVRTPPREGIDGMLISADQPTRSVRSAPDPGGDGELLIVGGEGHITGEDEHTEQRFEALEAFAREHLGATEVTHRWSAHDLEPADGLPYIGNLTPLSKHVWTAAGFRKWGFTNATMAAMELCERIQGRPSPWEKTFDANRFTPIQSAKGLAAETIKDARHMISDRMRGPEAESLEEIAPGEGKWVKVGGDLVAAFRDDDGTLTAVSPTCTHLGCRVMFNRAERSWDCPCHGSRFAPDGTVLQGPAVKPLERKPV